MTSEQQHRRGVQFVAGSAFLWSLGGTISRFIQCGDSWTVVFWRSLFAAAFLLGFMLYRDGRSGTLRLFRNMGWPGWCVALCFTVSTTAFVSALAFTTVANILLIQASVPLLAALMSWLLFREKISLTTWAAIAAVIAGVSIMVSGSLTGRMSPVGDGLAVLIAIFFAIATVITRRHAEVRMTPAVCLGVVIAGAFAATMAGSLAVSAPDLFWLVLFGALNLGAGLAFFSAGARLIPSALAALVGTMEPVLGPIWVWLVHGEVPSPRTIIGGTLVIVALFSYLLIDFVQQRRLTERSS